MNNHSPQRHWHDRMIRSFFAPALGFAFSLCAAACAPTAAAAEQAAMKPAASQSTSTPAMPAHPHAAHGVHGMVLFGEDGLFASHLPLYAHPHDWQVVLRLKPRDRVLAHAIREELRAGRQLTLEPERFDLLRLDPASGTPLHRFKGKLYRGHFERGGTLWQEVEFEVERTLVFRALSPDNEKPEQMQYLAFRDRSHVYLLHRIHGRPDFDQILSVRGRGMSATPQPVALPQSDRIESALGRSDATTAFLAARGWRDLREWYFETADLR
jgi:hypothetical protein